MSAVSREPATGGIAWFRADPTDPVAALLAGRPMSLIRPGLSRMAAILAALGHPERTFEAVHVAGTNGKGSTASFVAALLTRSGRSTALFTSPHLASVHERFRIDGEALPPELLAGEARRLIDLPEAAGATYFELVTALAFLSFAASGAEWAAVETGLGGRLDATNVLRPRSGCITTVGFDHMGWLGDSIQAIAAEKAGIIKRGTPVALGRLDPVAARVVEARARERNAPVVRLGVDYRVGDVEPGIDGTSFTLVRPGGEELGLRTAMAGAHQADNAAVAIAAVEAAGVSLDPDGIADAVRTTRVPGRFEVIASPEGICILDIAHNPEAIEALLATVRAASPPRPWIAVVSILADKPWRAMLARLSLDMDAIILTHSRSAPLDRRWDAAEVERWVCEQSESGLRIEADPHAALRAARELAGGGTVLVTGSAHTVADVRSESGHHNGKA